jgi:signal transduction histidine kinase/CheY-like chemotaxis protein
MSTKPAQLRAESHAAVGAILLRDAGAIVERWARRAADEQPSARRVHHDVLLDHLPTFLWELGRGLAQAHGPDPLRHCRTADIHGDQRWQAGWSIDEVVRDYQLLRVVVVEHLDAVAGRPLATREVLALGVYIDDAIAASVAAYNACQSAAGLPPRPADAAAAVGDPLDILGVLGHELRNPLAPLGNALQVLKLSAADPGAVERARLLMERQFRVMTRLVDDLLDLPRFARGKAQLRAERVDLVRLVRDVVGDRRGPFADAGVALVVELPAGPADTSGDPARLAQVLGNLVGNALKFTDRGGEVRVRLSADADRRAAALSVRDTGVGIDPAVLPRVFEPFVQADRTVERSRGGLGLGLALVKGIVELHGGSVRAASAGPGTGSEFVVELPLIDRPAADDPGAAPAAAPATARRVLVIEDNADAADSLQTYLEMLGHAVVIARSGPEGVRVGPVAAPDVVVCDIGLPGLSGHAVCAELRKAPALARTLFVALSGHADAGEPRSDGFDLYLLKPVEPARLAGIIAAHPAAG